MKKAKDLKVGDYLYITTYNGVDKSPVNKIEKEHEGNIPILIVNKYYVFNDLDSGSDRFGNIFINYEDLIKNLPNKIRYYVDKNDEIDRDITSLMATKTLNQSKIRMWKKYINSSKIKKIKKFTD